MSEILTETLVAKEGRSYATDGKCIATYQRYCLVFLPSGVKPDQNVRVVMIETGRDRNNNPIYQASSDRPVYENKWVDNGDGTASLITFEINWKFEEEGTNLVETRNLGTEEMLYTTKVVRSVKLRPTLVDSYIEETQVEIYHTKSEVVKDGKIVWEKTSERENPITPTRLAIEKVEVGHGDWRNHKLEVNPDPSLSVGLNAYYSSGNSTNLNTTWVELQQWVKDSLVTDYPICVCGRARYDVSVSDGYGKCEICRTEETCDRCGEQKRVAVLEGRLICDACKVYEEQEQLIHQYLTADQLVAIAREATDLLVVDPIEVELAGKVIENIQTSEKGYRWYYFTDAGVYATKLDKASLAFLQHLVVVSGDSLVDMVSWFVEGIRPASDYDLRWDFYLRTQVEGELGVNPKVTEDLLKKIVSKLESGNPVLSDHLRGSKQDKDRLEEWLEANTNEYRSYWDSYGRKEALVEAAQKAVNSIKGYKTVLGQIAEYEEWVTARQKQQEDGEIWMDVEVRISDRSGCNDQSWCISTTGEVIAPALERRDGIKTRVDAHVYGDIPVTHLVVSYGHDAYGYKKSEYWGVVRLPAEVTPAQKAALEEIEYSNTNQYFKGPGTGWDLSREGTVSYSTTYSRSDHLTGQERVAWEKMISQLPVDVTKYETRFVQSDNEFSSGYTEVGSYEIRDPRVKELGGLQSRLAASQSQLQGLKMAKEEQLEEYTQAEQGALERMTANWAAAPVEEGSVFEVTFILKKDSYRGEQLVVPSFYDEGADEWITLIADPYSSAQPVVGETYLVRVRPKNSQQVWLFKHQINNPEGRKGRGGARVLLCGYFAKLVLGPQDYDREIIELEEQIQNFEVEISAVEADIHQNPPVPVKPKKDPDVVWSSEDEDVKHVLTAMEVAMKTAMARNNAQTS